MKLLATDDVLVKMSAVALTRRVLGQQICNFINLTTSVLSQVPKRYKCKFVKLPRIGTGKSFRRIVHFKDEYTIEPLNVTNLGGRDPVSGTWYVIIVETLDFCRL